MMNWIAYNNIKLIDYNYTSYTFHELDIAIDYRLLISCLIVGNLD